MDTVAARWAGFVVEYGTGRGLWWLDGRRPREPCQYPRANTHGLTVQVRHGCSHERQGNERLAEVHTGES